MKHVSLDKLNDLPGLRLDGTDHFSFECRCDLACFNQCCRNLNLFLYPYDVVRLKNRLAVTSDQFLDHYVDIVLRESNFFPEVLLKMSDGPGRPCIFSGDEGCSIYTDRPYTCRSFPMDEGMLYNEDRQGKTSVFFFNPPRFCLGPLQTRKWTPQTWYDDQQAVTHRKMTALWSELKRLFEIDPWEGAGPDGAKGKMAFMAVYNVDQFRDFVFNSTFLKRYAVKSKVVKKIRSDDAELMRFGFQWIKLFVWGIKARDIRLR